MKHLPPRLIKDIEELCPVLDFSTEKGVSRIKGSIEQLIIRGHSYNLISKGLGVPKDFIERTAKELRHKPLMRDEDRPKAKAWGYEKPIQGGALEAFEELSKVLQPIEDQALRISARRGGHKQRSRNYKHWEM